MARPMKAIRCLKTNLIERSTLFMLSKGVCAGVDKHVERDSSQIVRLHCDRIVGDDYRPLAA